VFQGGFSLLKKKVLLGLLFVLLLAGCSGSVSQEDSKMSADGDRNSSMENVSEDEIGFSESDKAESGEDAKAKGQAGIEIDQAAAQRLVIYNAEMDIRVDNFEKARNALEQKAKDYNGYIVQSSSNRYDGEQQSGTMTFRIPQEHFNAFLNEAEGLSLQVNNRHVSGQDVTEEYVDLESRLKSKKAVEARLMDFMKQAQKTEDLLKISSDLAEVQEQIEQIAGRKKFLENQTALSTVTITLQENEVAVPKIDNDSLNTWQKIKKQFADNINILLAAGSGIIVFLVGNLPILIIIGAIVAAIIYFVRKKTKPGQSNNVDSNS
jgi:predicted metal-dependent hydrolase